MTVTNVWTQERRATAAAKINKEAARAARRLGAGAVVIIAFYPDGPNQFHLLDGGTAPMPFAQLYKNLATATATEAQAESPVGYIS